MPPVVDQRAGGDQEKSLSGRQLRYDPLMRMYPSVRSQVQIRALPLPTPTSTEMATSRPATAAAAFFSLYASERAPFSATRWSPNAIDNRSRSAASPDLPTAI